MLYEPFWLPHQVKQYDSYHMYLYKYFYFYYTMIFFSVLLAIAVPAIGPLIGLIGALCFSYLGLLVPCLIEVIIFWDNNGLGRFYWRLWKNVALSLFGIMALIFGTYTSMIDIIAAYAPQSDQPLNGTIALPMNISSTNSTF